MKTPRLAAVAVPAFALAIAFATGTGCTNDSSALIPAGSGNVLGGSYGGAGAGTTGSSGSGTGASSSGGNSQPSPSDAGTGSTPAPGTGGDDANAPRPDPDSGGVAQQDAGSSGGFGVDGQVPVIDSGTPQTGPLGSCTNPACGTDGNECGCQATDSQGNTVQLGCQAGGLCACFVNGNQDTNAFNEDGACNTQQATAQQFLQYCTQSCN